MENITVADETGSDTQAKEELAARRAVIACDELAAGKRPIHLPGGIASNLGAHDEIHLIPWSFDLLADPEWSVRWLGTGECQLLTHLFVSS